MDYLEVLETGELIVEKYGNQVVFDLEKLKDSWHDNFVIVNAGCYEGWPLKSNYNFRFQNIDQIFPKYEWNLSDNHALEIIKHLSLVKIEREFENSNDRYISISAAIKIVEAAKIALKEAQKTATSALNRIRRYSVVI